MPLTKQEFLEGFLSLFTCVTVGKEYYDEKDGKLFPLEHPPYPLQTLIDVVCVAEDGNEVVEKRKQVHICHLPLRLVKEIDIDCYNETVLLEFGPDYFITGGLERIYNIDNLRDLCGEYWSSMQNAVDFCLTFEDNNALEYTVHWDILTREEFIKGIKEGVPTVQVVEKGQFIVGGKIQVEFGPHSMLCIEEEKDDEGCFCYTEENLIRAVAFFNMVLSST